MSSVPTMSIYRGRPLTLSKGVVGWCGAWTCSCWSFGVRNLSNNSFFNFCHCSFLIRARHDLFSQGKVSLCSMTTFQQHEICHEGTLCQEADGNHCGLQVHGGSFSGSVLSWARPAKRKPRSVTPFGKCVNEAPALCNNSKAAMSSAPGMEWLPGTPDQFAQRHSKRQKNPALSLSRRLMRNNLSCRVACFAQFCK